MPRNVWMGSRRLLREREPTRYPSFCYGDFENTRPHFEKRTLMMSASWAKGGGTDEDDERTRRATLNLSNVLAVR